MKSRRCLSACGIALFALTSGYALAQGNGNGHGRGNGNGNGKGNANGHSKHGDDDEQSGYYQSDDRDIRDWYSAHQNNLPPGLAKKDRLTPGLEQQLVRRGTLPPGLQKRIEPCPPDLERRLPPPPPDEAHVLIGGHIVLLNRKTNIVIDIFHFE